MTNQELKVRKAVWEVISEFYLDTELQAHDYDYISKILIESNIELKELKAIDLYEVFPTLQNNLLSPAGEWAGFDTEWLSEECYKNHERRVRSRAFRSLTRLKNRVWYWMRASHWQEIEDRMAANGA